MPDNRSRARFLADFINSFDPGTGGSGDTLSIDSDTNDFIINAVETYINSRLTEIGQITEAQANTVGGRSAMEDDPAFSVDTTTNDADFNVDVHLFDSLNWYARRRAQDSDIGFRPESFLGVQNWAGQGDGLGYSRPSINEGVTIRSGQHFDSDFTTAIVSSLKSQSKINLEPGREGYNRPLQALANEISVEDLYDVNAAKGALVGQTLVWTGASWSAGTPAADDAENTLFIESAQIQGTNPQNIGFARRLAQRPLVFVNGHIMARDSDSMSDSDFNGNPVTPDVDYRILSDVLLSDIEEVVSGPGDVVSFTDNLSQYDEVVTVSPFVEALEGDVRGARWHKLFIASGDNGYDYNGANTSAATASWYNNWSSIAAADRGRVVYIRQPHTVTQDIDDRAGALMVFLNGQLMAEAGTVLPSDNGKFAADSDFVYSDSENYVIPVVGGSVNVASGVSTLDWVIPLDSEDEVAIAWLETRQETNPYNMVHYGIMIDSDHPLSNGRPFSVPGLLDIEDPESSLVFINGHLLSNTPVIEYRIDGDQIEFPSPLIPGDRFQIFSIDGPVNRTTLGDLSNVDQSVDSRTATQSGEVLINWNGNYYGDKNAIVKTSPIPIAWGRADATSSGTSNFQGYGLDSEDNFRTSTGLYEFILDSDTLAHDLYDDSQVCVTATVNSTPARVVDATIDNYVVQIRTYNTATSPALADVDGAVNFVVYANKL